MDFVFKWNEKILDVWNGSHKVGPEAMSECSIGCMWLSGGDIG